MVEWHLFPSSSRNHHGNHGSAWSLDTLIFSCIWCGILFISCNLGTLLSRHFIRVMDFVHAKKHPNDHKRPADEHNRHANVRANMFHDQMSANALWHDYSKLCSGGPSALLAAAAAQTTSSSLEGAALLTQARTPWLCASRWHSTTWTQRGG